MSRGLISRREYNKRKYYEYKGKGICPVCRKNEAKIGLVKCSSCIRKAEIRRIKKINILQEH